jgi:hypothetical protein
MTWLMPAVIAAVPPATRASFHRAGRLAIAELGKPAPSLERHVRVDRYR